MYIDILTLEESVRGGFTHAVSINYQDLAALANGNTGVFNITPLVDGDIVTGVGFRLVTPFVFSDGSLISNTASVGDTTTGVAGWLAATETASAGSNVSTNYAAPTLSFKASATGQVTFTGTAAKNLNTATAGQLVILFRKTSLPKFTKF